MITDHIAIKVNNIQNCLPSNKQHLNPTTEQITDVNKEFPPTCYVLEENKWNVSLAA